MGVNGWLILLAALQISSGLKSLPALLCSLAEAVWVFRGAGGALLGFWEPPPPAARFGAVSLDMGWHGRESQVYGHVTWAFRNLCF